MPRGDKPTTVKLALKDGWVYEDTLPNLSKRAYDWWYRESLVLDGVRMGPPVLDATAPPTTDVVLVDREQVALSAEEIARDYATRAARLRSDGSESALNYADSYSAKADAMREFAAHARALPPYTKEHVDG